MKTTRYEGAGCDPVSANPVGALAVAIGMQSKAALLQTALGDGFAVEADGDMISVDAGGAGFILTGAALAGPGWLDRAKVRADAARRIVKRGG